MSHPRVQLQTAMQCIPCGLFLMTAAADGARCAVPVKWVQQCSVNPPMIMVALAKGSAIEPLIRESRHFAICQVKADDRLLSRRFARAWDSPTSSCVDIRDDMVEVTTAAAPSGAPILNEALSYLDCEVARHVELDSDYRIYVGQVLSGKVLNPGPPAVRIGGAGRAA